MPSYLGMPLKAAFLSFRTQPRNPEDLGYLVQVCLRLAVVRAPAYDIVLQIS